MVSTSNSNVAVRSSCADHAGPIVPIPSSAPTSYESRPYPLDVEEFSLTVCTHATTADSSVHSRSRYRHTILPNRPLAPTTKTRLLDSIDDDGGGDYYDNDYAYAGDYGDYGDGGGDYDYGYGYGYGYGYDYYYD